VAVSAMVAVMEEATAAVTGWVELQVSIVAGTPLWVAAEAWFLALPPFIKEEVDVLGVAEHQVRIVMHAESVATPVAVGVPCPTLVLEEGHLCKTQRSGMSVMAVILVLSNAGETSLSLSLAACSPCCVCSRCCCGGFPSLTD